MDSAVFVASMNGLQHEIDALPPGVAQMISKLLELVDLHYDSIATLLAVNQKLLDTVERLKG